MSDPFSVAEKLATFVAALVVTTGVGVAVDIGVGVGVGLSVGVGVGVGVGGGPECAQYLPPVSNGVPPNSPPQTII